MIENIRKYTGLIIVVIVLLLLGFIFMDTRNFFDRSVGGGGTVVTVDGVGYNQSDVISRGSAPLKLASALRSFDVNGLEIMRFANTLAGGATDPQNAEIQFFAARQIIEEASEEFGIYPSDEEVNDFIRSLSTFQESPALGSAPGTEGEFSQENYNLFAQKQLQRFNLGEKDFRDLIRDVITVRELRTIIGGGLPGNRQVAEAMAVVNTQKVGVDLAEIDVSKLKADIKPTDEELKAYWEPLKESFQTDQRIKVTYALISPTYPEGLAEEPAKAPEGETEEQRTAREAADTKRADDRKEVEKDLAKLVSQFTDRVDETEGSDFEKLAKENGWELKSTDWVTRPTLPEDLKTPSRGVASEKSIADTLFNISLGSDPLAPFPLPMPVGKNQWFISRLDSLEEPREKTFEEAREEVLTRYTAEKADEAAKKEIEEKLAAMKTAIEGGKSFAEAAEALGLEAKSLGPFAVSEPLPTEANAREIFTQASTVKPGEFAEPLFLADRALIIRVTERQIEKDDNRGQQIDNYASNLLVQNENAAFEAWLNHRIEQAQVTTAK